MKLRVLIADDHDIVRRGLRNLVESHPGWEVCADVRNGREAVDKAIELGPDIAILDINMPEMDGLTATRKIRAALPKTEVLILTQHNADAVVKQVLQAGARGYILKSDAGDELIKAVEALRLHKTYFTTTVSEALLESFLKSGAVADSGETALITPREREIVQLLAEGKSNKEVATKLDMSVKTVETHRANIMRKLDLHSLSELVLYAVRNRIIQP